MSYAQSRCLSLGILGALLLAPPGVAQSASLGVRTVHPEQGDVTRVFRIAGRVLPFEEVTIRSKVTGFVKEIPVDLGSVVHAGDLLVRLDIPEQQDHLNLLQLELEKSHLSVQVSEARMQELQSLEQAASSRVQAAQARLKAAAVALRLTEITRDRYRQMIKDGSATPQRLDEAESAFSQAQAALHSKESDVVVARAEVTSKRKATLRAARELDLARAQVKSAVGNIDRQRTMMSYATLKAPFDGLVVKRLVHTGALVMGGQDSSDPTPLLHLCRASRLRVVVDIPESEVPHLKVGTPVRIEAQGILSKPIEAKVSALAGALNKTRLMPVEIYSADKRLIPGISVYVWLNMETHRGVLTVPSSALFSQKKQALLWVIRSGLAQLAKVTVGFDNLVRAEVKGVDAQAQIIVGARESLKAGMPVHAMNPAAKAGR